MKRRHFLTFLVAIAVSLLLSTGLKLFNPPMAIARTNTTLLVSAAASLKDALQEINPGFERANPNIKVNYNFGASGALQQQIEQGAPADIFLSAATRQMDNLARSNLILPNTRRNLLTNRLVLVVPRDSTLKIDSFRDLTNPNIQKISAGEPRSVPAGQYSEEVFKNLGILERIRSKLVFANSVRNVLAAVETGNADAGIVYTTDAKISDRVKAIATAPENLHSPIVYPMAVVATSKNQAAARSYLSYLTKAPARAIFEKFGFGIAK
ncbi:molybdate ABC transporter substrate-binding protein [Pannus brasiliensis CCIBt3594]|uniref:Molybdate ABC transporter substrate-binding protein n=1 Tax=Pannus brasiliensis CCIBt3594 TaxID=1427578 RepID=A0AAW9QPY5_9CHRO